MTLSDTELTWGTFTADGTDGTFTLETMEGWEGFDTRSDEQDRPTSDGAFDSPDYANARTVLATGLVAAASNRDARLATVRAGLVRSETLAPLTITHGGLTLTAYARLRRMAVSDVVWGAGLFRWAAEWRCPLPYRYATPVVESTGFAQTLGGLEFDLFTDGTTDTGLLEYGDPGTETGTVSVTNDGTAPAWSVFTVTGPTPAEGFDILVAGERLRYSLPLGTGESLDIDTSLGTVLLGGVDRRVALTVREWRAVEPGETVTVAFVPLGGASSGSLSVSLAPTYW